MSKNIKICLSGLGRTGIQTARYLIEQDRGVDLVSCVCSPSSSKAGKNLGEILNCPDIDVPIYSSNDLERCIFNTKPDVAIDFSTPFAALKNAEVFSKMKVGIVMGTTGFTNDEEKKLISIVEKNKGGIILAPNITRGINAMMFLSNLAAKMLVGYDIEIIEMHHNKKLDCPSGTAAKLKKQIKSIPELSKKEIPVSSVRAGGIVGNHKIMIAGENDMLEITHQSFSRNAFAEGALFAANFIFNKTGIYEMKDAMNYKQIIMDCLDEEVNCKNKFAKG